MADDRKRFLEAGADGYLTKPFAPEQLYAVIDAMRSVIDDQALVSSETAPVCQASLNM